MHWQILVQFLFRLAFGLTAAMAVTSPREVTSGFFRAHLWVVMGLNTFLAAIVWLVPDFPHRNWVAGLAIGGATLSYVGAVLWLYERLAAGWFSLLVVGLVDGGGLLLGLTPSVQAVWAAVDRLSSGWLLGITLAAMLLGHWYLNTPTMRLVPLQRLVAGMGACVLVRAAISLVGLFVWLNGVPGDGGGSTMAWAFVALRWLAGLVGVMTMVVMTWQTLKIPNTQSATGILYVAVIFVFLGELTSQFISLQAAYPV